ncbi:hypothetical protein J2W28_005659 [Variovorax boronicumulans]|uniref:hypothetical protein n=1 Tax=Variovorax boronicumulans TaxID=436515 RepID=UPI00277E0DAF|nr:hypothetical protein [Variovorax boronicumulans]MDP9995198.1 hypothetical protein [Variovorax boronicumulans]MDQ0006488.1 hypothetical protein [Variovorax boronicumulans]
MIAQLTINGRLRLAAPDDFSRLHCEFAQPSEQLTEVGAWIAGALELESVGTAWVELSWLRQQAPRPSEKWLQDLEQMIVGADRLGWISAGGQCMKAHVIWADAHRDRSTDSTQ